MNPAANNSTKAPAKPPSAPPVKNAAPKSQPVAPSNNRTATPPSSALRGTPTAANATLIPKGSVVLQVSALTVESDALKMAQELQQKKFPAFVLAPGADHFYRVQVGPYADAKSADKARAALEKEGFKPIVKH
jgi:cell division septation protein DedD